MAALTKMTSMERQINGGKEGRCPLWASAVATVCGVGHLRPGPGTWASAVTVLLWMGAGYGWREDINPIVTVVAVAVVVLIGIPAATEVSESSGIKDPQFVVIDEVAGQLIALMAAPLVWKAALVAFVLFRAFDIVKPPPVRQLEKLPAGFGIVIDDLAAGLYAFIGVHLLLHFGLLR